MISSKDNGLAGMKEQVTAIFYIHNQHPISNWGNQHSSASLPLSQPEIEAIEICVPQRKLHGYGVVSGKSWLTAPSKPMRHRVALHGNAVRPVETPNDVAFAVKEPDAQLAPDYGINSQGVAGENARRCSQPSVLDAGIAGDEAVLAHNSQPGLATIISIGLVS